MRDVTRVLRTLYLSRGAIQTTVAAIRRPRLRGQWPLILSGIGSVLGGLGWSGTADAGLTALATYIEGGAFFYLLTVGLLFLSARRLRPQPSHD